MAFEHLQPVDLALGWAVAPRQRDHRAHCVIVGQQAFGKAAQRWCRAVLCAAQPRVKPLGRTVSDEVGERLGDLDHLAQGGGVRSQPSEDRPRHRISLLGRTEHEPRHSARRE
jgi:hypothetical protein